MKTLVFCAGSTQPDLSILKKISPDLLVGVDGGATQLIAAGFSPDWAIGDFDSAPLPPQCPNILRLQSEKNDTDLEVALWHILQNYSYENIAQIIILGALGGGRLDHLLANIWLGNQERFSTWLNKIYFYENGNSLRFFQAGEHVLLHEPNKKYLSFISLTPIESLTLQGVKYPVEQRSYPMPTALISNEFLDKIARFSFKKGIMCVLQTND